MRVDAMRAIITDSKSLAPSSSFEVVFTGVLSGNGSDVIFIAAIEALGELERRLLSGFFVSVTRDGTSMSSSCKLCSN